MKKIKLNQVNKLEEAVSPFLLNQPLNIHTIGDSIILIIFSHEFVQKECYLYQVTNLINYATGISYKGVKSTVLAYQFMQELRQQTTVDLENPAAMLL